MHPFTVKSADLARRVAVPKSMDLAQTVEVADVIQALRRQGLTQAVIADATGASRRSVHNGEQNSAIRAKYEQRLRDLRDIVLVLRDTLTARGVGQWLRARNRILGGRRPIELLAEGKTQAVREAAESYAEGAYV
jgi:DNA-binding XRE family transcriptional regulator